MLLSSCLLFYMCCFLIRLFAVWRYAGRIFNAGICRGKAISEFRSPKALPLHPHPLGHGSNSSLLCVLRCWLLSVCCGTQNGTLCRSGFCIFWYLWWYAVPIWLLYSSIWIWFVVPNCFLYGTTFIMEHFSWTVSIYYDTHHEMLCRTAYFLSPACVHSRGNTPPHYNSSANKRITNLVLEYK